MKSGPDYICSMKPGLISCHGCNYITTESSVKLFLLFASRLLVSYFPKNRFALCLRGRRRLPCHVSALLSLDCTAALDLHPLRAMIPLSTMWQLVFSLSPPPHNTLQIELCPSVRSGMDAAHLQAAAQLLARPKVLRAQWGSEHMNGENTLVWGIINNLNFWTCNNQLIPWKGAALQTPF